MSLFKNFSIWPFKKHLVEKQDIEETCSKPIIIPEPTIEIEDDVSNINNHNDFNVLMKVDGEMFRVVSEHSHEIVRLTCECQDNEFKCVPNTYNSCLRYIYACYISKTVKYKMTKRLFVTDNGRFFYQNVYNDNSVDYYYASRADVQNDMIIWEKTNEAPMRLRHCEDAYSGDCPYISGTYTDIRDISVGTYEYNWAIYVNSYEVIDKERYGELINVL